MSEEAISEEHKVPTIHVRCCLFSLHSRGYKNVATTFYRPGYHDSKEKRHLLRRESITSVLRQTYVVSFVSVVSFVERGISNPCIIYTAFFLGIDAFVVYL